MAGDWLKMRHDLADDPAVIRLASICGIEEDAVIGKLFRLWSWADRHSKDGQVEGVDLAWVDRLARRDGYGAALVRVGWLVETGEGLSFPRFDRHCSDTAKTRALGKNRVETHRNATGVTRPDGPVTLDALPEKRREEKRLPPLPREGFDKAAWQTLRRAWNAGKGKAWKPLNPHPKAVERLSESGWLDEALKAIERLGSCRYFKTPVSLGQFCGPDFVTLCNGGEYDELNETKKGRDFGEAPPPPKAFTGSAAEAFERTRRALAAKATTTAKGIA
jgi:hypothetical protein